MTLLSYRRHRFPPEVLNGQLTRYETGIWRVTCDRHGGCRVLAA